MSIAQFNPRSKRYLPTVATASYNLQHCAVCLPLLSAIATAAPHALGLCILFYFLHLKNNIERIKENSFWTCVQLIASAKTVCVPYKHGSASPFRIIKFEEKKRKRKILLVFPFSFYFIVFIYSIFGLVRSFHHHFLPFECFFSPSLHSIHFNLKMVHCPYVFWLKLLYQVCALRLLFSAFVVKWYKYLPFTFCFVRLHLFHFSFNFRYPNAMVWGYLCVCACFFYLVWNKNNGPYLYQLWATFFFIFTSLKTKK